MATGRCERYWWLLQWRLSEKAQTITASWKTASQEVWKETKHWPPALARCLPWWVGGGKGDSDLTQRRSTARRPEKELLNKDCEVRMTWCMSVLFLQVRAAETSRSDPLMLLELSTGLLSSSPVRVAGWMEENFHQTLTWISRNFTNPRKSTVMILLSCGYAFIDVAEMKKCDHSQ